MTPRTDRTRSPRRAAAIGVIAVTLTVGAAGVVNALARDDEPAAQPEDTSVAEPVAREVVVPDDVPADASEDYLKGSEEYTQERADAFFGAGYMVEDAYALSELWGVELMEAKGRAGQLLLDGQPVPVAPGSSLDLTDPSTIESLNLVAYWDAGYTAEDAATLGALWEMDSGEAKVAGGQMLRDGQALPIAPSGSPLG